MYKYSCKNENKKEKKKAKNLLPNRLCQALTFGFYIILLR